MGLLGVLAAILGVVWFAAPVSAARSFELAGPWGTGPSSVPSEYKINGGMMTYQNCINNGFPHQEVLDWIAANIGTVQSTPIKANITQNSALNWQAGFGPKTCSIFVFWNVSDAEKAEFEADNIMVYPILKNGVATGYGLKSDCKNIVKYEDTQGWKTNGETQIQSPTDGWTQVHGRTVGGGSVGPMKVEVNSTVQWRHKIDVTKQGNPSISITANTVSKKGTTVVTLTGGTGPNITSKSVGADGMAWTTTNWKVPNEVGAVYCQYVKWSPREFGGTTEATTETRNDFSTNGLEQCVEIVEEDTSDWVLEGTTTLNGGTVDIQVSPCGTATWTHTLRKVGAVAYPGIVNFEQRRTEGDAYTTSGCASGNTTLRSGNVASLPATNPYNLPLSTNQVNTFTIQVPDGKTFCQNLGWTVPGDATKTGQTARLCATAGTPTGSSSYTSSLQACAVKVSSFGGTVEKCVNATIAGASAATNYAKTQDTIYFKYNLKRTAAYQSRQSANYKAAPAFDSSKTICSTNPTEGIDCVAKSPTAYTRPTSPGGKVTNKPGYLSPMMQDWNITSVSDCTLSGPTRALSSLAPSTCNASETQLRSNENFEYRGSGHRVINADLGLTKSELTQTISLKDIKIVVHRNDVRTYTYTYKKKHTETCSSDSWCYSYSCGVFGTSCCRDSCRSYSVTYYGAGRKSGTSCRYGCTGVNGAADTTATYTDQDNIWISVEPDGPIKADVSFAIPYNYRLTPGLQITPQNNDRIQLGGTSLGYTARVAVEPRSNTEVGETYATATRPDTTYAVTSFYVSAGRTSNPNPSEKTVTNAGLKLTGGTVTNDNSGACAFYTYDTGIANAPYGCRSKRVGGRLNAASETDLMKLRNGITLASNDSIVDSGTFDIADVPMGTKFCVSVAVMDKSSHGASDSDNSKSYGDTSEGIWTVYKPECIVVGKRPMTNVLGDGLYSDGSIEGNTFVKKPAGAGSDAAFGSYGEYEVVSNGLIRSFASGAALGTGAGGVPLGSATTATLLPSNLLNGSCQIAILTFRNSSCSTSTLNSMLGYMSGASSSHGLARNIRNRYTGRTDATNVSGGVSLTSTPCTVTTNTAGGTNCTSYIKANGDLTINTSSIPQGRTVIVEATGKVTIDGSGITLNNGSYNDIARIPQVLIFAGSIDIAPSVTRVDAWLLAGLNGGSGTINTCGGPGGVTAVSQLDGSKCTNQLKINGPVMASRIWLHRTAGAGTGMPDSARPAEVFYLPASTYLWAYNQSANLSQAYLTYAREVAPRF
jgi:hypothetical protein